MKQASIATDQPSWSSDIARWDDIVSTIKGSLHLILPIQTPIRDSQAIHSIIRDTLVVTWRAMGERIRDTAAAETGMMKGRGPHVMARVIEHVSCGDRGRKQSLVGYSFLTFLVSPLSTSRMCVLISRYYCYVLAGSK